MNKIKNILIVFLAIFTVCTTPVFAQLKGVVDIEENANVVLTKEVEDFISLYQGYSNSLDIDALKSLYSVNYYNSDGFDRETLMTLIKDTWSTYPDISYNTVIKSLRVNNDYATVHTIDNVIGHTANNSDITNDKGDLKSFSEAVLHLKKTGKKWEIVSDKVLFEKTILRYGKMKDININFYSPEQVKAGESYKITLNMKLPKSSFAIASLSNEEIVYPEKQPKESFRQMTPKNNTLERFVKANKTHNELAIASIGLTQPYIDVFNHPQLKISGVALVMQRINIIDKEKATKQKASK